MPTSLVNWRGDSAELVATLLQGKTLGLTQQGISSLMFGQRVAFVQIFCEQMGLTLGFREMRLCAPDGIDKLYTKMGSVT